MELVYIWFGKELGDNVCLDKEGKSPFENQGICFSNEYEITFKEDNHKPVFSISKNQQKDIEAYKEFYKTELDKDIGLKLNCFVGKNGAGKTLLLEYIKEVLSIENNNQQIAEIDKNKVFNKKTNNKQFLVIWNDSGELKYTCSENLKKLSEPESELIQGEDCKKSDIKELTTNIVYYSSTFNDIEFYTNYENSSNIFDISLNHVVWKENQKINEFIEQKEDISDGILNYDPFKKGEISRRIAFYLNLIGNSNDDIFKQFFIENEITRKSLTIVPSTIYSNLYKNDKGDSKLKNYISVLNRKKISNFIKDSIDFLEKKIDSQSKSEVIFWKIIREFWIISLFVIFKDIFSNKLENELIDDIVFDNIDFCKNSFLDMNFNKILDLLIKSNINSSYSCKNIVENLINYSKDFICLLRIMLNKYSERNNNIILSFYTDISLIKRFHYYYERLKNLLENRDFIVFEFSPRFSLGESSLITLFSRFYELFNLLPGNNLKIPVYNCKNLLILIDEGEIGYHPDWCKKYVKSIISFINKIFEKNNLNLNNLKNIHIILTTNNPIILSDILYKDVFYLTKIKKEEENENKKILMKINKGDKKTAFGANILDLYSDNFFMSDGLIGEFAKKKITELLEALENDDFEPKEEYEFLIRNIGDINIKNYVDNCYRERKIKYFLEKGSSND